MSKYEAALLNLLLELLVGVNSHGVLLAVVERLLVDALLDIVEQLCYIFLDALARDGLFLQGVAAHHLHGVVLEVAATHHEAYGYTLELVVGELESGALVVGIVVLHADAHGAELRGDALDLGVDGCELLGVLVDGHDNHLYGGELRRKHEAVVVRVSHDERTHQTG